MGVGSGGQPARRRAARRCHRLVLLAMAGVLTAPAMAQSPAPATAPSTAPAPAKAPVQSVAPARTAAQAPSASAKGGAAKAPPTAVIAVLDRRAGMVSDHEVKAGQTFRAGRLSGVMRDCQKSRPPARLETAAFLQLFVTPRAAAEGKEPQPEAVFSGWMFVESPSLNPLRHASYDVWVRSCTIREPEIAVAPSSVAAPSRRAAPPATRESSAPQVPEAPSASPSNER